MLADRKKIRHLSSLFGITRSRVVTFSVNISNTKETYMIQWMQLTRASERFTCATPSRYSFTGDLPRSCDVIWKCSSRIWFTVYLLSCLLSISSLITPKSILPVEVIPFEGNTHNGCFLEVIVCLNILTHMHFSMQGHISYLFSCTGLRPLKAILSQGYYELRIDLTDFEGGSSYAHYDHFDIGDITENYRLKVTGYIGTAGIVHCIKIQ